MIFDVLPAYCEEISRHRTSPLPILAIDFDFQSACVNALRSDTTGSNIRQPRCGWSSKLVAVG